jgi:glutamate N-acetyltransferase / amino-acid N-acetyltransferase
MTDIARSSNPVYLPKGFRFSAVSAGIKASGRLDLALAEAVPGTTAAAVFTKNRVVAAPVEVGRAVLAASRGLVRALIVNSGNANCATGAAGLQACKRICQEVSRRLQVPARQVFPSSTGIIGVPLPVEKMVAKLPELVKAHPASKQGIAQFAQSIMTTDTRPKLASARFHSGNSNCTLLGVAKGSGMIHPQLATMLVYLFTDCACSPGELKRILRWVCDQTFNCISVDGDMSTNDTVLLLASGQSGVKLKDAGTRAQFADSLLAVCRSLAEQIVCDGEGVQHLIRLIIKEARNRDEAMRVARAVASSCLVKTAWAGADPNWGRILAAVGASGILLDAKKVSISIGDQLVCQGGVGCAFDAQEAHRDLAQPHCKIHIRLRRGSGSVEFLTSDLTAEYVRINADYST